MRRESVDTKDEFEKVRVEGVDLRGGRVVLLRGRVKGRSEVRLLMSN